MVLGSNITFTFVSPHALKNPFYFVSTLFICPVSWFVALQRRKQFYTLLFKLSAMAYKDNTACVYCFYMPLFGRFSKCWNPDSGFLELKNSNIPCLNKASGFPFSLQRSEKQEAPWLILQGITGDFSILMCSKIYFSDAASRNSLQLNLAVKRSENDVEATRARASVNKSPGKFFFFPCHVFLSIYHWLQIWVEKKNNLHY